MLEKDLDVGPVLGYSNGDGLIAGAEPVGKPIVFKGAVWSNNENGVVGPPDTRVPDVIARGTIFYTDPTDAVPAAYPLSTDWILSGREQYGIVAKDAEIAVGGTADILVYVAGTFNQNMIFDITGDSSYNVNFGAAWTDNSKNQIKSSMETQGLYLVPVV